MGIKIPRITMQIDYGDDTHFGELSLIAIGYGIHLAWIYSSMFDAQSIFGGAVDAASQPHLGYFVSIALYGIMLLAAAARSDWFTKQLYDGPIVPLSAVVCSAGTLILFAPTYLGASAPTCETVSGVLTGLGSAPLLLSWGSSFARRDMPSIVTNSVLAIIVGFFVYAFVLHAAPQPLGGIAAALIPLVETFLVSRIRRSVPAISSPAFTFGNLPVNLGKFVFRLGAPVLLLGIALGIMRQTSLQSILASTALGDQVTVFLSACCATALILMSFLALGGNERWSVFFRPLAPFIALAVVFMTIASGTGSLLAVSITLVGYMTFETFMWIFFAELAQRFRIPPVFVFGLGRGFMAVGSLAGTLMPQVAANATGTGGFGEGAASIVLLVVLIIAFALLPDENEIVPIVQGVSKERAAFAKARTAQKSLQDTDADPASSADERLAANDTSLPENERLADRSDTSESSSGNDAPTGFARCQAAAAHAPARHGIVPDTMSCVDMERGGLNGDIAGNTDTGSNEEFAHLHMRCERIANIYLLSRRETEVMFYLARGYNSSYIQEKLYISEGTAKTHIRHIYRKVDVHSQQELMKTIDSIEP